MRRRDALAAAGVAAVGGAVAGGLAMRRDDGAPVTPVATTTYYGDQIEAFHSKHQAGIATHAQTYGSFVALTLHRGTDRAALGRMMRLLSDDAARLTRGEPA